MITPQEIRKKAENKYSSFLKAFMQNEPFFPLEIRFRKVKSSDDYQVLRQWVGKLIADSKAERGYGYRLELQERNHRQYGTQSLPQRILFETADDYLKSIGKTAEFGRFAHAIEQTRNRFPTLLNGWMGRSPKQILPYLDSWEQILEVCAYFVAHPRPNIYMREIPVPVDSKFVENHQAVLRHLLDELLPAEQIQYDDAHFARRFGLRYDEPQIRLRLLDDSLTAALGWPAADLTFRISDCATLAGFSQPPVVLIVENKMNFLTLPAVENGIVIWGKGFQVSLLKKLTWLAHCQIWYWGDIDAQGFEILSQMRQQFPQTKSFLMDSATLDRYHQFTVPGTPTQIKRLQHLTVEEQAVYHHVAQSDLRLEQEHILQPEIDTLLKTFTTETPHTS